MKSIKKTKWSFLLGPLSCLFLCLSFASYAQEQQQDSIPEVETDSSTLRTIVIRSLPEKAGTKKAGAAIKNHTEPLKKTAALQQRIKRFHMPSFWTKKNRVSFNLNEVAFVNWNAGGDNSVAVLTAARFERNYAFRYISWENALDFRFGLNMREGQGIRKTDDALRFTSTFGYRTDTISKWYTSGKLNFNTQLANGYKYPNTETPISRLMAPGYLFLGVGTSYIDAAKKINLYISPLTQKATFVLDQRLANQGAFGVEKAILDPDGNILTPGKNTLMELGFLVTHSWEKEVYENVQMISRLNLYTDYLNSFGNIDIDWELNFNLKVNQYISAQIGTHIIYDDDIKFDVEKAADGSVIDPGVPKTQFKQLLGVGVVYEF
ncbi:DUF3078 domain-containing protein [Flavobacteriaceae bacterium LSUCC0859]|nr:DUF3078 domain-containing protein [Flavobacteriaceae bacterium LSUCC0859]